MVVIDSETVLQAGMSALSDCDPVMSRIIAAGAIPALRRREPGFAGLCWIVTGQQLSTASANAIWNRIEVFFETLTPSALLAASVEDLRSLGLSEAKVRTLRAAAEAVLSEGLPLDVLNQKSALEAHALMTAVKGIGPWTADIYLTFCLGHADIFPAADLALQEAAKLAYGLDQRPSAKSIGVLAEQWQPWRGVAARVLWAYYRQVKSRDGAPVTG